MMTAQKKMLEDKRTAHCLLFRKYESVKREPGLDISGFFV